MKTWFVSAFTTDPLSGNPAAVCLLDRPRETADLQAIATALNQPATAFVLQDQDGWAIRWFAPEAEIDLCGHATLAAAFAIWSNGAESERTPLTFHTPRNRLIAVPTACGRVRLDFPALLGRAEAADADLIAAVGLPPMATARHGERWIFEYANAADVRAVRPDFARLRATGVRALIVTARSDVRDHDIISRNFPPLTGVDEDQVTGMAHTCLATYWHERLGNTLRCWQASPRGGEMTTMLRGERVLLEGDAVLALVGTWLG